jgi:hypothetical protein
MREPPLESSEDPACFERYANPPVLTDVTVTEEVVATVAAKLSGGAGPSGADPVAISNWLLRFGKESELLRQEIAAVTEWLSNSNPPWAAYRAMMAGCLIALDKQPGTRPVGVGEVWRRLMAKCVIKVAGRKATAACGTMNLCAGLSAGIEGAVHVLQDAPRIIARQEAARRAARTEGTEMGHGQGQEDDAGVEGTDTPLLTQPPDPTPIATPEQDDPVIHLMVDAMNGFNELGRKAMFWTVGHLWPAGARFSFNCYRHQAKLVMRREGRPAHIILSKEGVTQGDPLSMILYGTALVPLAKRLVDETPEVIQPWYADDAAMAGRASKVRDAMRLLQQWGPDRGYFPEPAKSIVVCERESRERAQETLQEFKFVYKDGHRYLGGFLGSPTARREWLEPQIALWKHGIGELTKVARRFPQTAFAGLARSFQSEWTYLQRVTKGVGEEFAEVERAIEQEFLPTLFDEKREGLEKLTQILRLSAKQAGLGIPSPRETARRNYRTSVTATNLVQAALCRGGKGFLLNEHNREARTVIRDARKVKVELEESVLNTHLEFGNDNQPEATRASEIIGDMANRHPEQDERHGPVVGRVSRQSVPAVWPHADQPPQAV